jgi:hypothetical protein
VPMDVSVDELRMTPDRRDASAVADPTAGERASRALAGPHARLRPRAGGQSGMPGSPRLRGAALGVALVAVLGLTTGCEQQAAASVEAPAVTVAAGSAHEGDSTPEVTVTGEGAQAAAADAASTRPASALGTVALLPVKGRAPKTGYTRDQFGPAWQDVDHNGCDTRNDVLRRDLTAVVSKPGTHDCVVLSGVLADPYSGRTISFTRGQDTSAAVQIDHVVALSDAWQKGAQQWDAGRRAALGNDPLNLLAVDGPVNAQKGDGDTATWLPPNKAYRCAYVARQVGVKYTYGLWVTAAERDAMVSVLSSCPDEPLPAGSAVPPAAAPAVPAPAPAPAPAPTPAPTPAPEAPAPPVALPSAVAPLVVTYANCTEVWAAGAAPVHVGEPGYATHLDRDGDGIGCEKRP